MWSKINYKAVNVLSYSHKLYSTSTHGIFKILCYINLGFWTYLLATIRWYYIVKLKLYFISVLKTECRDFIYNTKHNGDSATLAISPRNENRDKLAISCRNEKRDKIAKTNTNNIINKTKETPFTRLKEPGLCLM